VKKQQSKKEHTFSEWIDSLVLLATSQGYCETQSYETFLKQRQNKLFWDKRGKAGYNSYKILNEIEKIK